MFKDVAGQAIIDFYRHEKPAKLWIHNRYGPKEEMPINVYFRKEVQMPLLELTALQSCTGKVLDIGAGAGSHSLVLQQRGLDVTGLDISPLCMQVMQQRGLQRTVCADIFNYSVERYHTLLMLMNGIGLAGTLARLEAFFSHARALLLPGGQLLLDSSDVAYLYRRKPVPTHRYYGEVDYQYQYKSHKTDWFSWLYVDGATLTRAAARQGWQTEVLYSDGYDQYLARLVVARN